MQDVALLQLLAQLRVVPADPPAATGLVLHGFLLRSTDAAAVRIIVGELLFEFPVEDILAVSQAQDIGAADELAAIPVELTLRQPTRLLALAPAGLYVPLLDAQALPFAYAVRQGLAPMQAAPGFRAREHEFRKRHGLE